MQKDIVVKKSKISGRGIFALRDFKKGEIILKWNPKPITKAESEKLSDLQKNYILHSGRKYFLMQAPEKYMNHSCEASTLTKNFSYVAKRNIKKWEEITSNYGNGGAIFFKCNCGSKKCKGVMS